MKYTHICRIATSRKWVTSVYGNSGQTKQSPSDHTTSFESKNVSSPFFFLYSVVAELLELMTTSIDGFTIIQHNNGREIRRKKKDERWTSEYHCMVPRFILTWCTSICLLFSLSLYHPLSLSWLMMVILHSFPSGFVSFNFSSARPTVIYKWKNPGKS